MCWSWGSQPAFHTTLSCWRSHGMQVVPQQTQDLLFFCLGVQRYGGSPSRRANTISLTTKHPTYTPPPLLDPEGELLVVAIRRSLSSLFIIRPCLGISASSPAVASASASRWPSVPVCLAPELHLLGFQKALGCPGSAVSLQDNKQKVKTEPVCSPPWPRWSFIRSSDSRQLHSVNPCQAGSPEVPYFPTLPFWCLIVQILPDLPTIHPTLCCCKSSLTPAPCTAQPGFLCLQQWPQTLLL